MNHKAFSLFFIAFFVLIFCLSTTNSRRLSGKYGNVPQRTRPKNPPAIPNGPYPTYPTIPYYPPLNKESICKKNIIGKCIATKKIPHLENPCKSFTNCPKMKP
ncbi:hypothetical protein P3L10_031264 [Capsicum annuum]